VLVELVFMVLFRSSLFAAPVFALPVYVWILFACFLTTAFLSATHDIAIDGYYLDILDKSGQAAYSGIRVTAYRIAMVLAGGVLVMLAGGGGKPVPMDLLLFHVVMPGFLTGWSTALCLGAGLFLIIFAFHLVYLPHRPAALPYAQGATAAPLEKKSFMDAFSSYLDQKRIVIVLLFIIFFRIGDFLWKPMSKLFLLDIGVSVSQIGFLQGVVGIIATILGSITGGIYIAKKGLTRGLWVLGAIQSVTLLLYAYLAIVHKVLPKGSQISGAGFLHVGVINAFENFAYGLGTIAFVNFLMRTCKKEYTATHYAIATSLMALSTATASFFSGFLQGKMGYMHFFIFCFLCSIPGLIIIALLPLKEMETAQS
jgi:MFS transporter, PAT family, beta-lactamase induction signal transducer AmpG